MKRTLQSIKLFTLCMVTAILTATQSEALDWQSVDFDSDNPPWNTLTKNFEQGSILHSKFIEARKVPFKKKPIMLWGDMWIQRGKTIHIHYLKPKEQLVSITENSMHLHTPNGAGKSETKEIKEKRIRAINESLYALINAEFASLQNDFQITGRHLETTWQLKFAPIDPDLQKMIQSFTVSGEADSITSIIFERSSQVSITIKLFDQSSVENLPEKILTY